LTPAARVAAAITVLDDILRGRSAEQALSAWARASRFAGSKDRAALRDLVFDALRRRASCAALGGGLHGRGLMIGLGQQQSWDMDAIFTGAGYAAPQMSEAEHQLQSSPPALSDPERHDLQDWQWDMLQQDLGQDAGPVADALRDRAPLFLRVNMRKSSVEAAVAALAEDQITAIPPPIVDTGLEVTSNERRVKTSRAYADGLVEIQDAASQIAVAGLDIRAGARVLDYCAGGGGKALAISDQYDCDVTAHDIDPGRMRDIGPRAARAGCQITAVESDALKGLPLFDVVVVDAPCSGSGTWRRNPEAKWALTKKKLFGFQDLQQNVLRQAAEYLRPGGRLVYMTCSIFNYENQDVTKHFCSVGGGVPVGPALQLYPSAQHDGFYCEPIRKD